MQEAIDKIQKVIKEIRQNGEHHAEFVRSNGELVIAGLEIALDILNSTEPEPCDDTISKQAAIDILDDFSNDFLEVVGGRSYETARKKMCSLPSAQPEQRWIPCSERLPEKCGVYLVSGGSRVWLCELVQIMTVYGWANDARNPVVTAWMPLPEPYKTIQRGTE